MNAREGKPHAVHLKIALATVAVALLVKVALSERDVTLDAVVLGYCSTAESVSADGIRMVPIGVLSSVHLREAALFGRRSAKGASRVYVYSGDGTCVGQILCTPGGWVRFVDRTFELRDGSQSVLGAVFGAYAGDAS